MTRRRGERKYDGWKGGGGYEKVKQLEVGREEAGWGERVLGYPSPLARVAHSQRFCGGE